MSSKSSKRKNSLHDVFEQFLRQSDKILLSCTPIDVRNVLIWKDKFGKTIVHNVQRKYLGQEGKFDCICPRRLSSGTVENIIVQLKAIF